MNKRIIIATAIVATLLGLTMAGLRHVRNLDNQIKLKEIQIIDNGAKLKLLDSKYTELNKELEKTGSDKKKVEEQLQQLEKERQELEKALQAKIKQKEADRLAKAQKAVTGSVHAPKAYAATCGDNKFANAIYMQESGCNLTATNSIGCIGIGQSCPASKLSNACPDWKTNYDCQNAFFTAYAMGYGGWEQAYNFKYCLGSCYSTRTKTTVVKKEIWW